MLFGWLATNYVEDRSIEKTRDIESRYSLDLRLKQNKSNILKMYARLIDKCSSRNITKIKSLLGELQQMLFERRQLRVNLTSEQIDSGALVEITALERDLLKFCQEWILIKKQNFEFMNFLVGLEQIGDTIRLLMNLEETARGYPLAQAV